jgi:DNA (cytosine-5)-methyltransferase 1
MDSEIRVLDLFSGIGGFSLGLERSGPFRTVAFCEREPFPQAVLRKHWPDTPIYDDVRTIPTDRLGRIDLICGGFPCQPWSVAGEQRGAEDDRDLWPVMASLIEKLRPRWVVGENVRGFVNEPLGLQRSLSDLEILGYQTAPFVIPACAVDAPHRRDRVWIVANAAGERREGVGITGVSDGRCSADGRADKSTGTNAIGGTPSMAHADSAPGERDERAKRGNAERTDYIQPCRWLPEPDVGRVANGVPRRMDRLKALGNAVVPQVVEQIGRAIMDSEINA